MVSGTQKSSFPYILTDGNVQRDAILFHPALRKTSSILLTNDLGETTVDQLLEAEEETPDAT
jgi:hypothetical protein